MNSVYFFLPFILIASVGIYQDSFAVETVTGYDYFDTTNPDGSHTWSNHYPYIQNQQGQYVPFLNDGTKTETNHGSVILNTDGSYSFYKDGIIDSSPLFTDRIIAKYADVSDLTSWTYPNSINNDTPDILWDGDSFVSTKQSAIGKLEYKYILDNGKWKTQLEATNLSALTTKAFGFDQIIDLNRDTIKFGGQQRNLDNFNTVTFDKEWLTNNEAKVIDFLNDISFDFDLGFENLYSVTVYDTGINSSQLVFDYRTTDPLLPNETLVVDPTYSSNNPTVDGQMRDSGNNGSLDGNAFSKQDAITIHAVGRYELIDPFDGARAFYEFDVSSIPSMSNVVSAVFKFETGADIGTRDGCEFRTMSNQPSVSTDDQIWHAIGNGTMISNTCPTASSTNQSITLDSDMYDYIESQLSVDWVSIGIKSDTEGAQDATHHGVQYFAEESAGTPDPTLEITYHPIPDAVTTLTNSTVTATTANIQWSAPNLNGGTLQNYVVNYTNPHGNPLTFVANTTNTYYNVTGLAFGTNYSFRVSSGTEGGFNTTAPIATILNITTSTNIYSAISPSSLIVYNHNQSPSILDLEWIAPLMDNINGYRIFREAPVGGGFGIVTSNTTNSNQYYNNTGLTVNNYYNYKVAAINQSGISGNSSTYSMTTFHLPDSVDDLTATVSDLDILLDWTQPDILYGYLTGYNINYTTPLGVPLTVHVATTGDSDTDYIASGFANFEDYSFRVSAITTHGKNVTSANIANATAFDDFEIGTIDLDLDDGEVELPIYFVTSAVDADTSDVQVYYDPALQLACDFRYTLAGSNTTYTGLTENVDGALVYSNFTINGINNDVIDIDCWDELDDTVRGQERIGQAAFPLKDQITDFQDGVFGTNGKFGAFDFITLLIVVISMIGFNRTHPYVGVIAMFALIGFARYFDLIGDISVAFGAIMLVVALAVAYGRRENEID